MVIITVKFSVFNIPNLLYDLQDGIAHNQTGAKSFWSQTYWPLLLQTSPPTTQPEGILLVNLKG